MQPAPPLRSSGKQQRIGAGQDRKARKALDHRGHVGEVAGGILDAGERSRIGRAQPLDQRMRDRLRRHLRDSDRARPSAGHRRCAARLRCRRQDAVIGDALVVERRQHHDGIDADRERVARQRDGVAERGNAGAGQQPLRRDAGGAPPPRAARCVRPPKRSWPRRSCPASRCRRSLRRAGSDNARRSAHDRGRARRRAASARRRTRHEGAAMMSTKLPPIVKTMLFGMRTFVICLVPVVKSARRRRQGRWLSWRGIRAWPRLAGKAAKRVSETPPKNPKNYVASVGKAFAVLKSFTSETFELTLSEIAARADLDRGTAFRLIQTLIELGYLQSHSAKPPVPSRRRLSRPRLHRAVARLVAADRRAAAARPRALMSAMRPRSAFSMAAT